MRAGRSGRSAGLCARGWARSRLRWRLPAATLGASRSARLLGGRGRRACSRPGCPASSASVDLRGRRRHAGTAPRPRGAPAAGSPRAHRARAAGRLLVPAGAAASGSASRSGGLWVTREGTTSRRQPRVGPQIASPPPIIEPATDQDDPPTTPRLTTRRHPSTDEAARQALREANLCSSRAGSRASCRSPILSNDLLAQPLSRLSMRGDRPRDRTGDSRRVRWPYSPPFLWRTVAQA